MPTGPDGSLIPLRLTDGADSERADAARNRRLLLAAAKDLIDNHGASAVTMDAVAREAGVGKGTVFRRFGSRTGLMLALLDHSETEIQRDYLSGPPPLGPGAPPLQRLLAYGRARLKMTNDHLDVLIEAGGADGDFMTHPVWAASNRHVQILLQQLGFGDRVDVVAIAVHAPLNAGAVKHLRDVIGLDLETIITEWEKMVQTLAAGVDAT
ncbi:TetR/AcrR family transcriptional regulator [Gordonia insulae]|uniref:HTH-type transcriptional regulator BetI n=1 Tax=Gordonia insulae TaxID=2420509 RepID=A0A3G8JVF9_9ACTN|nr:TetR/AcrR family transcriptional regulator [Gordonia insulae]AZG48775.1 HTH-type transcriptional regulator BetI [Gordonia insulae]